VKHMGYSNSNLWLQSKSALYWLRTGMTKVMHVKRALCSEVD